MGLILGIEAKTHPQISNLWVSSCGRVFKRINVIHPERRQWYEYRPHIDRDGYLRIRVHKKNRLIHRLVYETYCGPLISGQVVCHLNGDPTDNRPSNLLQASQQVNISHKLDHGTHQIGETHPRSVHTQTQIQEAKQLLATAALSKTGRLKKGEAQRIAEATGVSIHTVYDIKRGKIWA